MLVTDGLQSLLGSLGDPSRDKMAGTFYGVPILTDDQLLNAHRGSWINRKVVDIPAKDSVRAWRAWTARTPENVTKIEAEEKRLGVKWKYLEARIKARLFGGAAIFIGTDDVELRQPLDPKRIKLGGVRYLSVISRIECQAGEIENDPISPFFGKPRFYRVGATGKEIDASRFARFIGLEHAESRFTAMNANYGWGDSVLLPVHAALKNVDAGGTNAANLLFEANIDIFKTPDLAASASNPRTEKQLIERFALAAANKAINRSILMDAAEAYERKAVTFNGIPDVLEKLMLIAAGAADIPVTRLIGMSPAGLSATGESDLRNYYDSVNVQQELEIAPATTILDECIVRSALGDAPADVLYNWNPLWQMGTKERAEVTKIYVDSSVAMISSGMVEIEDMAEVLGNQLGEIGSFAGIENARVPEPPEPDDKLTDDNEDGDGTVNVADAEPRSLYISRKVKNAAEIIAWAKSQGFENLNAADDLHVTIAHSRQPVDWIKVGESWEEEITIAAGGPRIVELFGTKHIVLQFASSSLTWRHERVMSLGGESDYPEYQPHVTFATYSGLPPALRGIVPFTGRIELGPEIFEEVRP